MIFCGLLQVLLEKGVKLFPVDYQDCALDFIAALQERVLMNGRTEVFSRPPTEMAGNFPLIFKLESYAFEA